jgi:hypothetical protein
MNSNGIVRCVSSAPRPVYCRAIANHDVASTVELTSETSNQKSAARSLSWIIVSAEAKAQIDTPSASTKNGVAPAPPADRGAR